MPTSRIKNTIYRAALPFLSPAAPGKAVEAGGGRKLYHQEELSKIIRRNRISGGAFHFQCGREFRDVFSRAIHTELVPDGSTYYRVASITKMAVALLSVRLMDKGILDPDTPLSVLLPDGKKVPDIAGIRFCHLLAHTSGLADPPDLEKKLNEEKPWPDAVTGYRFAEPGVLFRYSNLGYGLIGCVIENLLNQPMEAVFQNLLFSPLGMHATLEACSLPEEQIMPVIRMLPYRAGTGIRMTKLGRIPLGSPDPVHHYGHTAGSLYADLPSVTALLQCIRDGGRPIISPRFSGYMKQQISDYGRISPTLSYGSGLLIIRDPRISDSPVYGHQGFAYGCVDGAFWEEESGNLLVSLNGGCSEARDGRLGIANLDLCRFAFRKELPQWKQSGV